MANLTILFMNKKIILTAFFLSLFFFSFSQFAYRINADILTKTRLPDSTFQISKGKIYYDQNFQKIIFDFTFPQRERVVLFDTVMCRYKDGNLISRSKSFLIPKQSYFNFILSGNISNYGFDNSNFEATSIKKEKGMVITTWSPPDYAKKYLSKVLVATRNKQLYSVTIFGSDDEVLNRQILKKYQMVHGMDIPHEILVATYLKSGTMYQIITLNHVVLNEQGNDQLYNYEL